MSTPKQKAPPPPKWWSPSAGVWLAGGFLALAAVPYLSSATQLMARGETASLGKVAEQVKKKGEPADKQREVKGLAVAKDGTVFGGGKNGVFTLKDGQWNRMEDFTGHDVKAVALDAAGTMYVLHHDGVSMRKDGAWSEIYEGEAHNLALGGDGSLLVGAMKPAALMKRQPDGSWQKLNDGLPTAN